MTGWPIIPPEHDRPHPPPANVPLWSESFFWFAYDPKPRMGVVMHVTRAPFDPGIWRAILAVYLPGDELLVSKSYGRRGTESGPGTGPLQISCEAPLERWRIRFDGAAQRLNRAQLGRELLSDARAEGLAIDLTFEATAPIYDLHQDLAQHSFASAHQQQAGTITGTIHAAGVDATLDCFSYRDHGWGPRDLSSVIGDAWNAVRFPEAGLVCSIDFTSEHAHILRGYHERDQAFRPVTPIHTPPLTNGDGAPRQFALTLDRDGDRLTINAEVVHHFTFTFAPPNDVLIGSDRSSPNALHVCEAVARYELDGEIAYGLCERMTRSGTLT